ncbi:MAG TPA: YqgE/AlgH family protein [Turneriella sp.]|nr:YqgE/AlgH family protein [Turneriella sp.]
MDDKLKGKLLIASSAILDGNFNRSVVLLVDHDSRGSLGLVLNHPLPGETRRHKPLFAGGPVDPEHRSLLHGADEFATGEPIIDGVYFESSDDLLPVLMQKKFRYRRFCGYAGWSTGQLEYELRSNSWVLLDARPDLVFHNDGYDLWRRCLIEKGGVYRHFASTHKSILLN